MTARNLTFVFIKCGNVIHDLSHYEIVKTTQSPSFATAATIDSIVRLFRFQGQITMNMSQGRLSFLYPLQSVLEANAFRPQSTFTPTALVNLYFITTVFYVYFCSDILLYMLPSNLQTIKIKIFASATCTFHLSFTFNFYVLQVYIKGRTDIILVCHFGYYPFSSLLISTTTISADISTAV
jgi:hypothetical protein